MNYKKSKARIKKRLKAAKVNKFLDKQYTPAVERSPLNGFVKAEGKIYADADQVYKEWDKENGFFTRLLRKLKQLFSR